MPPFRGIPHDRIDPALDIPSEFSRRDSIFDHSLGIPDSGTRDRLSNPFGGPACDLSVDIWERNKELICKRTDIGEHFTREVIQSIVFIFLPLGERVHLTNRYITTNPLGNKECSRCE